MAGNHDFTQYSEHRTRSQMQELVHYGHWIPLQRGKTDVYLAEHFPGWSWNDLWNVCQAAGILVREPNGRFARRVDSRVDAIHFSDEHTFAVEWVDGTVSTHPSETPPPLGRDSWASRFPCPRRGTHTRLTDCWLCWSDVHRGACLERDVVLGEELLDSVSVSNQQNLTRFPIQEQRPYQRGVQP